MFYNQNKIKDFFSSCLPNLFNRSSFHRVHLQHVFKETYNRGVQILRGEKHPIADLLKKGWHMVVVKGKCPTQQGIENDPAAPDIHLWTSI